MHDLAEAAFIERRNCINCGGDSIAPLSGGRYHDQPLLGFLQADPWGEDPIPFLRNATWELGQCGACGQVFHTRILDGEWNERRFARWMTADAIHAFEARLGPPAPRRFAAARARVEHVLRIERLTQNIRAPGEPVRLLDFGCGFGEFLEAAALFGFEAVGVDRSHDKREEARIHIATSLDDLDTSRRFHAITLFEVLEHLDHPGAILDALAALIAPGGILVLETPDCEGVTGIASADDYARVHPLEHINAFTHATLRSIAERRGFRTIDPGPAYVTADRMTAVKVEARRALGRTGKSTQLYFRAG